MSQQLSVAIVIPAHNEERFIGKCLDACLSQTSAPDEIIVVNNKSSDNTVSIVRRYQEENPHIDIRLLNQNEHLGIAPTRNCGFDHARSQIIGRIDADSVVDTDWVETIRQCFQDSAIDAVTGRSTITTFRCVGRYSESTAWSAATCIARQPINGSSWAPTWQSGPRRGRRYVISRSWIWKTDSTKTSILH
ncbi:glycosyl transferase 2 family protein [Mycobacterium kansasii 824]|nr:glycosyl transferase 2 family protein [Mycobacterium kansasii 824]